MHAWGGRAAAVHTRTPAAGELAIASSSHQRGSAHASACATPRGVSERVRAWRACVCACVRACKRMLVRAHRRVRMLVRAAWRGVA
jgi:hypothetical protein